MHKQDARSQEIERQKEKIRMYEEVKEKDINIIQMKAGEGQREIYQ